jgi:NhaP-type Na+/H+ or K+/H+ antiporter
VVGPLLDFIRPSKTVNSVLKWEGTLADPIGATLGVVVFNAVIAGHAKVDRGVAGFLLSIVIGAEFGLAGVVLVLIWVHWFKPTQSQAVPGTLMLVVAMVSNFACSGAVSACASTSSPLSVSRWFIWLWNSMCAAASSGDQAPMNSAAPSVGA